VTVISTESLLLAKGLEREVCGSGLPVSGGGVIKMHPNGGGTTGRLTNQRERSPEGRGRSCQGEKETKDFILGGRQVKNGCKVGVCWKGDTTGSGGGDGMGEGGND